MINRAIRGLAPFFAFQKRCLSPFVFWKKTKECFRQDYRIFKDLHVELWGQIF